MCEISNFILKTQDDMEQQYLPIFLRYGGAEKLTSEMTKDELDQVNTPLINSDEKDKGAWIAGLLTVNAQEYSNREAMRLIEEQTKTRNSFAIETNLADLDTWKFLLEMQKTG